MLVINHLGLRLFIFYFSNILCKSFASSSAFLSIIVLYSELLSLRVYLQRLMESLEPDMKCLVPLAI